MRLSEMFYHAITFIIETFGIHVANTLQVPGPWVYFCSPVHTSTRSLLRHIHTYTLHKFEHDRMHLNFRRSPCFTTRTSDLWCEIHHWRFINNRKASKQCRSKWHRVNLTSRTREASPRRKGSLSLEWIIYINIAAAYSRRLNARAVSLALSYSVFIFINCPWRNNVIINYY